MALPPRFRDFAAADLATIRTAADRARVLDHYGNRGTDFEQAVTRYLRDRVEPEFTVCAGEVIDTFAIPEERINRDPTHGSGCLCLKCRIGSRQHDIIVHWNTRQARRFTFGSGLRMVPVEAVAAIVEVKLSLELGDFRGAEKAASITARLRTRTQPIGLIAGLGSGRVQPTAHVSETLAVSDDINRPRFYVLAADGPSDVATLARWMREEAKIVDGICVLDVGFVGRSSYMNAPEVQPVDRACYVSGRDTALLAFAAHVVASTSNYEGRTRERRPCWSEYDRSFLVSHYDDGGFRAKAGPLPGSDDLPELLRDDSGLLTDDERTTLRARLSVDAPAPPVDGSNTDPKSS